MDYRLTSTPTYARPLPRASAALATPRVTLKCAGQPLVQPAHGPLAWVANWFTGHFENKLCVVKIQLLHVVKAIAAATGTFGEGLASAASANSVVKLVRSLGARGAALVARGAATPAAALLRPVVKAAKAIGAPLMRICEGPIYAVGMAVWDIVAWRKLACDPRANKEKVSLFKAAMRWSCAGAAVVCSIAICATAGVTIGPVALVTLRVVAALCFVASAAVHWQGDKLKNPRPTN